MLGTLLPMARYAHQPGLDSISKTLYRVFTWAEIEPIYGQPWKESQAKAVEARRSAAKRRRGG